MTPLSILLQTLQINDLQREDLWPSALIDGHAHYSVGPLRQLHSPIDASTLGAWMPAPADVVALAVHQAERAFDTWRQIPAPQRGDFVRRIGSTVRLHKTALAELVMWETGKIRSEAEGEVQEWIDICDHAAGLSRQLAGYTFPSERPSHRLMEQWHPLGPVAVITAFNFPLAVWAWNAMLALVCGDSIVWKPSEKTPLCALAAARLVQQASAGATDIPPGLVQIVQGDAATGALLAESRHLSLVSATGSVRMGRALAPVVAARLGRSLLELGGNNAAVLCPSADIDQALRAIVFAATGTCGQRCTTLRRLLVHESMVGEISDRLASLYARLPVGDPREPGTLVGPLIDAAAGSAMQAALDAARKQGGECLAGGERVHQGVPAGGCYVRPALVYMPLQTTIVQTETFAPILYLMLYHDLDEAIDLNNAVSQGLASAIFTRDQREAERFLAATGSDCGIVNVNTGTSGAEIGGAFGGEKDTGGGRESGSDAWKNYMRRSTSTINYSDGLPLAQGVNFEV